MAHSKRWAQVHDAGGSILVNNGGYGDGNKGGDSPHEPVRPVIVWRTQCP